MDIKRLQEEINSINTKIKKVNAESMTRNGTRKTYLEQLEKAVEVYRGKYGVAVTQENIEEEKSAVVKSYTSRLQNIETILDLINMRRYGEANIMIKESIPVLNYPDINANTEPVAEVDNSDSGGVMYISGGVRSGHSAQLSEEWNNLAETVVYPEEVSEDEVNEDGEDLEDEDIEDDEDEEYEDEEDVDDSDVVIPASPVVQSASQASPVSTAPKATSFSSPAMGALTPPVGDATSSKSSGISAPKAPQAPKFIPPQMYDGMVSDSQGDEEDSLDNAMSGFKPVAPSPAKPPTSFANILGGSAFSPAGGKK